MGIVAVIDDREAGVTNIVEILQGSRTSRVKLCVAVCPFYDAVRVME